MRLLDAEPALDPARARQRSAPRSKSSFWTRSSVARSSCGQSPASTTPRSALSSSTVPYAAMRRVELRDARAVAERGLPRVAAARVDARQADRLVPLATHVVAYPTGATALVLAREDRARDHDPLDLARSLVDLRDLRVAVVALDRELLRVAVAAEHLDRLLRDCAPRPGGEQLRLGALAPCAAGPLLQPGRAVRQQPRGVDLRRHVGELELDRLEVGDPLAELPALQCIGARDVVGGLGDPHRLGRDADAPAVEGRHGDREASALLVPVAGRGRPALGRGGGRPWTRS